MLLTTTGCKPQRILNAALGCIKRLLKFFGPVCDKHRRLAEGEAISELDADFFEMAKHLGVTMSESIERAVDGYAFAKDATRLSIALANPKQSREELLKFVVEVRQISLGSYNRAGQMSKRSKGFRDMIFQMDGRVRAEPKDRLSKGESEYLSFPVRSVKLENFGIRRKELKKACYDAEELLEHIEKIAKWWHRMMKELDALEQSILKVPSQPIRSTCFSCKRKDWEILMEAFFDYQREITQIQDRYPLLLNHADLRPDDQYCSPPIEITRRYRTQWHVFVRKVVLHLQ